MELRSRLVRAERKILEKRTAADGTGRDGTGAQASELTRGNTERVTRFTIKAGSAKIRINDIQPRGSADAGDSVG